MRINWSDLNSIVSVFCFKPACNQRLWCIFLHCGASNPQICWILPSYAIFPAKLAHGCTYEFLQFLRPFSQFFLATSPHILATSPHILATSPPPDVLGFSPVVFLIFSGCICNFSVCILNFSGCSTCCWFLCEHSFDPSSKKDLFFVRSGYLKRIEPLMHRSTSTNKASDCTFLWPMLARSCRYSNLSMFSLFSSSPASKFQYGTTNLHRSWNYCPWLPPTSCPGTFFNHQALEILKQAPLHPDISSLISLRVSKPGS